MPEIRVAVFATHPIQYHAPLFRGLAQHDGISLKVYYALLPDRRQQGVGFGIPFSWDIPLLEGYAWEALVNTAGNPGLKGFFNSSTPYIKEALSKERPDVALITGWQSLPLLQALWSCKRLGIPMIIRGESNSMKHRPGWTRLAHKLLLSNYSAYLTIGKSNRDFYLGYGIPGERLFPCGYFVDNERFSRSREQLLPEREHIRKKWGIGKDAVCFVFSGKLEPKKCIMDLLKAFEKARKAAPDIHLLVAGTGELMGQARQFAAETELPVSFAGFLNQSEIISAYVAGDCLVLPSDFGETWGLVVNEAMVCGLPAIVSDRVGCGRDLVENGVTGFIVPFGNIEALADRIVETASDSDRRRQMGSNAEEKIKHYSVEKAVEGTLDAIAYVTDGKVKR